MPDFDTIYDQVSQSALNQVVCLDQSAQILRGQLTTETSFEDSIALTHALLAINHTLLAWAQYLLPGRSGPVVCPACAVEAEEEEG